MKGCAICGQVADRGSFCADCKAALERARNETISRFQLHPAALAAAGERAAAMVPHAALRGEATTKTEAAAGPRKTRLRRMPLHVVLTVVALALGAGGYVAYQVIETSRDAARAPPHDPVAHSPVLPIVPTPLAETAARAAVLPPPAPTTPAKSVAAAVPSKPLGARAPEAAHREPPPPPGKPSALVRPVEETPKAPVAAAVAPVAAPTTASEPALGRWQRMDQALRACGEEALFARIVCEQKVRFRFCDGQWDQNPRCPGNPNTDHGQ